MSGLENNQKSRRFSEVYPRQILEPHNMSQGIKRCWGQTVLSTNEKRLCRRLTWPRIFEISRGYRSSGWAVVGTITRCERILTSGCHGRIEIKGKWVMFEGILGILHLIVAIWAILSIIKSSASGGAKVLWVLLVLLLPLIGLIIWFLMGPKGNV